MKMKDIRARLHELGDLAVHQYGLQDEFGTEIHFLAEATRRRDYVRRRKTPKKPISLGLKKWIRTLRKNGLSYEEISSATGVYNHGRLSEICTGIKP